MFRKDNLIFMLETPSIHGIKLKISNILTRYKCKAHKLNIKNKLMKIIISKLRTAIAQATKGKYQIY